MKKLLLILTFTFSVLLAYSQNGCTPDSQYQGGGIYPSADVGLSNAIINQPYSENITIITPADTAVDIPPLGPITADIISIELTNVTGLPSSFSYACDPVSCDFPGGTIKCAELYSTNVTDAVGLILESVRKSNRTPKINLATISKNINEYLNFKFRF